MAQSGFRGYQPIASWLWVRLVAAFRHKTSSALRAAFSDDLAGLSRRLVEARLGQAPASVFDVKGCCDREIPVPFVDRDEAPERAQEDDEPLGMTPPGFRQEARRGIWGGRN